MTDPLNILNEDLTTVDTSRPLLAKASIDLQVASLKLEPNKAGTGQNINIMFKTVNPERSTSQETINPGFPVFHTMSVTPTEKFTPDMIKKNLRLFQVACDGESAAGKFGDGQQYVGKTLTAIVGIREDASGSYPPSNTISRFVTKG